MKLLLEQTIARHFKRDTDIVFNADEMAGWFLRVFLIILRRLLVDDISVNLLNIGTLAPYIKKATRYRHPETGDLRTTKPKRIIRFIASSKLKKDLQKVSV